MHYIGIDVGGTKIAIGLFNEQKELVSKSKIPTDKELSAKSLMTQ